MIIDKSELKDILGVSLEGIKTIEKRKQLGIRLDRIGYKLIERIKRDRKVYYSVECTDENKQLLNNIYKYVFEVDKYKEFTKYFKERTEKSKNFIPASLKSLGNKASVSITTIHKWDIKLLNKKIISSDGYFYFKINKDNHTIEEVSKEEYTSYWRNKSKVELRSKLHEKFNSGEISFDDALDIAENFAALKTEVEGKYLYRTKRYKLNEDNLLYLDIIGLI